jgi:radical SAM superfamily enzyme YgiQ (UPF0313 family)
MNILLINPKVREWAAPNCFPLGLGYIAAVLREAGHSVHVLDWNAMRWSDDEFLDLLGGITEHIDMVGLTGIITQYKQVKEIAEDCATVFPEAYIACGGSLATSVPKLLLKKTKVQFCIIGEGERAVLSLIKELERKNDYTRSIWQADFPTVNLSFAHVPMPAYDLFPMEIYLKNPIGPYNAHKWVDGGVGVDNPLSMNIIGSRGCPYRCLFCTPCFGSEGYRLRPPGDIVSEMLYLKNEYNTEYVHFVDDAFACNKGHITRFCEDKLDRFPQMPWSCTGRANLVDEEMVRLMAEAGCIGLWYGLESGSQYILDRMNKKIAVNQYRRAIGLNRKYFKYEDYTFIVGCPSESDETVQESINFCKEMEICPSAVFFMTPYPGSHLFNELLRNDPEFLDMVNTIDLFEGWVESLGEQGEHIAWNCSGAPDEKLKEWHQKFIEETGALNKEKH